jgi:hypothetical protein
VAVAVCGGHLRCCCVARAQTIAAVTSADVSVFDVSDAPKKLWSFSASSVADVVSGQWAGAESVFVCGPVTSTAATVTVLGAADGRTARSVDIEWAGGVAVDSVRPTHVLLVLCSSR